MHRNDWQKLAATRLKEAKSLLKLAQPSGSYYLAGYAIECALKAWIAKRFRSSTWPDQALVRGGNTIFTHKLSLLVGHAELVDELRAAGVNHHFAHNWRVLSGWSPDSRYDTWTLSEAHDIIHAVEQRRHGVLPCLRKHW